MSRYIETDYLWEAVGNLRNAAKQPCYKPRKRFLLQLADEIQDTHDEYFPAPAEPKETGE